jgi:hypothetical protein
LKTAPLPESGPCTYKGIMVACGPPGPAAGKNLLYHNNGDGTLTDVSKKSGIWDTIGNCALGVAASDLDDDLRPHLGLDQAQVVDSLEVRWPSGQVDTFKNLAVNRLYVVTEGAKSPQAVALR